MSLPKRILNRLTYLLQRRRVQPYEKFSATLGVSLTAPEIIARSSELAALHQKYVSEVSSPEMAASLELCAWMAQLCGNAKFKTLADLGSGFTSYVLRRYAQPSSSVWSVDDSAPWLEKTRTYLQRQGVNDAGLSLPDAFYADETRFDFILLDLNFVEERIHHVERVLAKTKPGGLVIFDDVHKIDYQQALLRKLSGHQGTLIDLTPVTYDRFKRFAWAFIKS